MKRAALCASLLCACSFPAPPTLLPPPFGPRPENPEAARLFFPTGIAIDSTGTWVVVTNSNTDRLYDAGATYSLRASELIRHFPAPTDSPAPELAFPASAVVGKVITGNYTGPLVLGGDCAGGTGQCTAYAGSRDTNRLNAVALDTATGALTCRTGNDPDCRGGIDLNQAASVEGPFGVVVAKVHPPGREVATGDVDAIVVNSLVSHIDSTQSGTLFTSSHLAVFDQNDLSTLLFGATVTDRINGTGIGGGPIVFDDRAREVIVGGCYTRFGSASAGGEPSTFKCGTFANGANLLRFLPLDAGASAVTRLYDIGPQIRSVDTTALALGPVEVPSGGRRLYVATRLPDTVARLALSPDPAFAPVIEWVSTISTQPATIVLLQRPAGTTGPDLLAVAGLATYETSTTNGKLVIVDATTGAVLGQVDGLGDSPFGIAQFPPAVGETSARLAVTMFGSCGISLVEVPFDAPSLAKLAARIGSCPP
jgi:hypothetical protein